KPNGQNCMGTSQCVSNFCVDGVCCDGTCTGTCLSCNLAATKGTCTLIALGDDPDNECAGTDVCNGNGVCAKVNGTACAMDSECASTVCYDGVCCNAACGGACRSCNIMGSIGTCAPYANGTDPEGECAGSLNCNGAYLCESPHANGTACTVAGE